MMQQIIDKMESHRRTLIRDMHRTALQRQRMLDQWHRACETAARRDIGKSDATRRFLTKYWQQGLSRSTLYRWERATR